METSLWRASDNFIDFNGTQLVIDTDNFSVDGAGNASFSGDIAASEITGSTFKTSNTGRRLVIDGATNFCHFSIPATRKR